ncbi:MAG: hypothetical protein R3F59_12310 [Myxococcota bacterium]
MRTTLLLLTLAACDGSGPADPIQGDPADPIDDPPPSTYIFDEDAPPEPTASLAQLSTALQEALDLTLHIRADPVQAAYETAMSGSTGACPYVYSTPDGAYWYDSCTANDGTQFEGYVFAYGDTDLFDPGSGFTFDYWYAFGGATIDVPSGDQLELAGRAVWQVGVNDNDGVPIVLSYTDVGGTFHWDGAEADDTWMRLGIDPDLTTQVTAVPSYALATVYLGGGFGGFADGWAVGFDENVIGDEAMGLPCAAELSGTLGLRAPDGTWYDVQFDGSDGTDPDFDPAACDGCGHAYYQGEPMGEVCADFSTLMGAARATEVSP